jgi:CubicO group peptidase (beta-lactamase class C family)
MRFAEALRNGGVGENGRIVSPAMVELMRRNHTGEMRNDLFNFAREWRDWPSFPANLGIGIALRGTGMHPSYFGHLTSPNTFGYMGLGSTLFWVDPARQLTFTCMTTGLIEETASADRFQRLSDLAVAAADAA